MKKLFTLFILSLSVTQKVFAGHHPAVEANDNSIRNFLIGLAAVALVILLAYFIQKKSKK